MKTRSPRPFRRIEEGIQLFHLCGRERLEMRPPDLQTSHGCAQLGGADFS